MCVDQELSERHAKRRQLTNKSRTSRTIDKMKGVRLTKRGHISVPLVLAAIDADVIDALGPLKILGSRLPRVVDTTLRGADAELLVAHRQHEEDEIRRRWFEQNPYAASAAA